MNILKNALRQWWFARGKADAIKGKPRGGYQSLTANCRSAYNRGYNRGIELKG